MIYPILFILSDWAHFLLRLILGFIIFTSGKKKFATTQLLGIFEMILGLLLFIGLMANWASLLVFIEVTLFFIVKLYKKSLPQDKILFNLLIIATSLVIFTKGAGFISLDESWLQLF